MWTYIIPLLSSIVGGLIGTCITLLVNMRNTRRTVVHDLLVEGLEIYALPEAWILEGKDRQNVTLSGHARLPVKKDEGVLWLQPVEVRAVFEQECWNYPKNSFYGFLGETGRRAWIIRDRLTGEKSGRSRISGGEPPAEYSHQALLSSKAIDNLCGWIERVSSAWLKCFIGEHEKRVLRPLLDSLTRTDVAERLKPHLTSIARSFLVDAEKQYEKDDQRGIGDEI